MMSKEGNRPGVDISKNSRQEIIGQMPLSHFRVSLFMHLQKVKFASLFEKAFSFYSS